MLAIVLAHRRSGAPTLLAFAPDGAERIAAERAVVRQLGDDAWVGSLGIARDAGGACATR